MNKNGTRFKFKPIKMLEPQVARKIAAGEVIDRPCAVLRELLDNAVDAGARRITVETESGGISRIRVSDNGCGMTKEDLQLCAHPHATSKIVSDSDLEHLTTLGFRGEALASIAAVSHLEITTSRNGESWRLETGAHGKQFVSPSSLPEGTTAVCTGLFGNFPARHRFLKRPQAETLLCKQIFIDKSLPFPETAFRLICDSKIRFDFPAGQTQAQRFCSAVEMTEYLPLFYEIRSQNAQEADAAGKKTTEVCPWNFSIILGESSIYRSDRKLMYIFVNGRRVQEYALLQALDYGAEGYFPNGTHPAACLFLNIDSSLVDFNIHPAKKEVRFKDLAPIHHAISSAVRNFYRNLSVCSLVQDNRESAVKPYCAQSTQLFEPDRAAEKEVYPEYSSLSKKNGQVYAGHTSFSSSAAFRNETAKLSGGNTDKDTQFDLNGQNFRFIGSALGVFLIAEKDGDLYLVDQHAGHERLLFERFLENAGEKQRLLVPLVIEAPCLDDDKYLESLLPELNKAGFTVKNCGSGRWETESVPIKWQGTERDLQNDLLDKRIAPNEILRSLAATSACRAAIKDGHVLDPASAEQLLTEIFALKDPHCPHGRPIWTKIGKDELLRAVRRTE